MLFKKNGTRCPKCFGKPRITTKEFKKEVYYLVGDEYSVLGEYVGAKTKILMKHNKCNCEYEVAPHNFIKLNGTRCPKCYGNLKKTTELFKKEVYDLVCDEYTVLGEYINSKTKIKMKHNECGFDYYVTSSEFTGKDSSRCPKCNISKGESTILFTLNKYSIKYEIQYKFEDCKYKNSLPFDFALFSEGELILLIEYDGIQHFKSIKAFGGRDNFEVTKIRDNIKTQYCRENNIPLLRIPYWEFDNINKIILKKLFRLGLI